MMKKVVNTVNRGFVYHKYVRFSRSNVSTQQKISLPKPKFTFKKKAYGVIFTGIGIGLSYDYMNDFKFCGSVERFLRSLKIAVLISMDYSWSLYGLDSTSKEYDKVIKHVHLRSAEKIVDGCMANGGLYVKIGQGVSALNHILPKEYTSTLQQLEDKCLQRKPGEVNKLFMQEFGKTPNELFETFDYDAIAAASLAQVFKATTKEGNQVAVKVQYIDLINRFYGDFKTIYILLALLKTIHKQYNFNWAYNNVRDNLVQELDFIHEGHNAERCAADMAKLSFIHIPKVYWDYTTKRVLTAEWIDGYKITNLEQIAKDKLSISEIDKKLFSTFSEQIFNTGFVHADPHPGNVFLRKNKKGNPEIILLDHGLYEYITESTRYSLCKFWEAIALKDRKTMAECAKELNVDDYEKFAELLLQRPLEFVTGNFSTRLTDEEIDYFQTLAKERFNVILDTLKQMPRSMIFVIRNLNTVRAIARTHGDPIDRPKHMARYAQKCLYKNRSGVLSYIKWTFRRVIFEMYLFKSSFQFWLVKSYLNWLVIFKRSPDTSKLFDYDYENDV